MTKPTKGQRAAQIAIALGKSACYLLLFVGMQVLISVPFSLLIAGAELSGNTAMASQLSVWLYDNVMLLSFLSGLFTIAVILAFYLIRRKKLSEALWLRPLPAPTLLTGATLAPAFYLVVTVVLASLPYAWQENYSDAVAHLDTGGLWAFLAIVVAAPLVEEFIFRGLVLTRLTRAMPGWLAVLLSAAVFGALHSHPIQFAYAFALGCFFGAMDLRTNSIWPSILAHFVFNLIGQIFSALPDEGADFLLLAVLGVLLLLAIILPILNHSAIAALFRRKPAAPPPPPPPAPGQYDFDPWDS